MTEFFDSAQAEQAKKQLAEERKVQERTRAEYNERMKGRPTPTQEENDLAALGAHIMTRDDDGSGPDPFNRHIQAGPPGSYHTRHMTAGNPPVATHRAPPAQRSAPRE